MRLPSLQPTGAGEYLRLRRVAGIINASTPVAARVVDVGGGSGMLGRRLRRDLQTDYTVVDSIPQGFGRRITGDITNLSFPDRSVDVLTCNDVLEHVLDDASMTDQLLQKLRPGGLLITHVPAIRRSYVPGLAERRARAEAADEQPFPHVRDGYTRTGLRLLLQQAAPLGSAVQVLPSFTDGQSLVADVDWMLWAHRLTPLRPVTYGAARLARGIGGGDRSAGWLGLVRVPQA